jgi:hypothetical protein
MSLTIDVARKAILNNELNHVLSLEQGVLLGYVVIFILAYNLDKDV